MPAIRLQRQLAPLGLLEPRRQLFGEPRPRLDKRRPLIDQLLTLGLPCSLRFMHRRELGSEPRQVCLLVAPTFAVALYLSQLIAGRLEPFLEDGHQGFELSFFFAQPRLALA